MPQRNDEVVTERTRLVLMSTEFIDLVLTGKREEAEGVLGAAIPDDWPDEEDRWLLRLRSEQMREDASSPPWLARAIVDRGEPRVLGHIGFHGPPDERGIAEVGYTVFAEHRRQGIAEETVRALVEWAHAEHGVIRFRASVAPDNVPSLRLIEKLGFFRVGVQWDERDGQELVFEANYPLKGLSAAPSPS